MDHTTSEVLEMVTTRTIPASVEKVWDAWSNESLVKQWWGPRGFTAPVAKMDFSVGGKSLVCMRSPEGFDIYNTWAYTEIIPHTRIVFLHHFSDENGNAIDPSRLGLQGIPASVPHTITLTAIGETTTAVTVRESGYTDPEVVALSKAGMDECLDKMSECLTACG